MTLNLKTDANNYTIMTRLLHADGSSVIIGAAAFLSQSHPTDEVVEFAPGFGVTARLHLARDPASYTAVEGDAAAATVVRGYLPPRHQCASDSAEETELPTACASVVFGEAMHSMPSADVKTEIVMEAVRLLQRGADTEVTRLPIGDGRVSAKAGTWVTTTNPAQSRFTIASL